MCRTGADTDTGEALRSLLGGGVFGGLSFEEEGVFHGLVTGQFQFHLGAVFYADAGYRNREQTLCIAQSAVAADGQGLRLIAALDSQNQIIITVHSGVDLDIHGQVAVTATAIQECLLHGKGGFFDDNVFGFLTGQVDQVLINPVDIVSGVRSFLCINVDGRCLGNTLIQLISISVRIAGIFEICPKSIRIRITKQLIGVLPHCSLGSRDQFLSGEVDDLFTAEICICCILNLLRVLVIRQAVTQDGTNHLCLIQIFSRAAAGEMCFLQIDSAVCMTKMVRNASVRTKSLGRCVEFVIQRHAIEPVRLLRLNFIDICQIEHSANTVVTHLKR